MTSTVRGVDNFDTALAMRSGSSYSAPVRAINTVYTNTSGRVRWVTGYANNLGSGVIEFIIDGVAMQRLTAASAAPEMPFCGMVPPGSTYQLNTGGTVSLPRWRELDL